MDTIRHFLKGIAIGATMMVPGVSGGTMALILGIYDEIISSMSNLFKDFKKNASFLLVTGIGGLIGLFLVSGIVNFFISNYKFETMFLFLGIVFGGLPVLIKKANSGEKHKNDYIWFVLGVIIIGLLLFFEQRFGVSSSKVVVVDLKMFIYLLFAGVVIAVALILPGISTSFLLLTLGLYEPTLNAIQNMDLLFLTPVVVGTLFGVFATTKVLENLMNNKPRPTYLMIIGFVIASLFEVFPGIPKGLLTKVISIITFVVGYYFIIYITEKFED